MGRKHKPDALKYVTCGFSPENLTAIAEVQRTLHLSFGAAVRHLIRQASAPPSTPKEAKST
ncbi:hypothetical protein [Streptomyces sp. NPDC087787]|uniref:hypothetical protein n=1 Tax=Streptomyces sp. NPDC087787 TaxID=3365803 RepID=UPI00380E25A5